MRVSSYLVVEGLECDSVIMDKTYLAYLPITNSIVLLWAAVIPMISAFLSLNCAEAPRLTEVRCVQLAHYWFKHQEF